jgi:hypothetical protein
LQNPHYTQNPPKVRFFALTALCSQAPPITSGRGRFRGDYQMGPPFLRQPTNQRRNTGGMKRGEHGMDRNAALRMGQGVGQHSA